MKRSYLVACIIGLILLVVFGGCISEEKKVTETPTLTTTTSTTLPPATTEAPSQNNDYYTYFFTSIARTSIEDKVGKTVEVVAKVKDEDMCVVFGLYNWEDGYYFALGTMIGTYAYIVEDGFTGDLLVGGRNYGYLCKREWVEDYNAGRSTAGEVVEKVLMTETGL